MEYTVIISNQFKKDFRRCIKRGLDMKLITDARFDGDGSGEHFLRK